MAIPRQIPEVRMLDSRLGCDVCGPGVPATRCTRPGPRAQREPANYCSSCAKRYVGFLERTHPIRT